MSGLIDLYNRKVPSWKGRYKMSAENYRRGLFIGMLLGLAGCIQMPADVAAELDAPDESAVNNYLLRDNNDSASEGTTAAGVRQ